jgi:hypothetical protein
MDWQFVHVPKAAGSSVLRTLGLEPGVHMPASSVPGHEFYFAFVRSPYDRLVSAYFFVQRGNLTVQAENYISHFRPWLMSEQIRSDMVVEEVFRPMVHYLDAPVDFLGRYENLQADFDRACSLIGVGQRTLRRDNASKHPPWRELYDQEMLDRVYELYREDFESFGYERIHCGN